MIDLLERPAEDWQIVTAAGMPPAIHFYYGVRHDAMHLLPLGATFGVVNSPNTYVHPDSNLRAWSWHEYQVGLYQYRRGRPLERSYRQIARRQLTRFEVPRFEALWLEITMMGKEKVEFEHV